MEVRSWTFIFVGTQFNPQQYISQFFNNGQALGCCHTFAILRADRCHFPVPAWQVLLPMSLQLQKWLTSSVPSSSIQMCWVCSLINQYLLSLISKGYMLNVLIFPNIHSFFNFFPEAPEKCRLFFMKWFRFIPRQELQSSFASVYKLLEQSFWLTHNVFVNSILFW